MNLPEFIRLKVSPVRPDAVVNYRQGYHDGIEAALQVLMVHEGETDQLAGRAWLYGLRTGVVERHEVLAAEIALHLEEEERLALLGLVIQSQRYAVEHIKPLSDKIFAVLTDLKVLEQVLDLRGEV